MSEFVDKDIKNSYKIINNNIIDVKTSEIIYTIEKKVINKKFLYINNTHYFMIHYYKYYDFCKRVTINLLTKEIYINNDATIYLINPLRTNNDGNIIFSGGWCLDDLVEELIVKIHSNGEFEILERIINKDEFEILERIINDDEE